MTRPNAQAKSNGRHGVVAVLVEEGRYLAIRRSQWVSAPRLICFPGGGIEEGEDYHTAIRREMMEELSLEVEVLAQVWKSRTYWGTDLEWMLVRREPQAVIQPDPREVEEVLWLTEHELLAHPNLLGSVPDFFQALRASEIILDGHGGA
jgi:8-oxo-dGTP diphosphatase